MSSNTKTGSASKIKMESFDDLFGGNSAQEIGAEQIINAPQWANIIFSEELFLHSNEYSALLKEMMHKHRNLIMEHLVLAVKNGEIRSDIAPADIFRMLAGSLRLLIKQWGFSGKSFDLQAESTMLFNAWDVLWKIK